MENINRANEMLTNCNGDTNAIIEYWCDYCNGQYSYDCAEGMHMVKAEFGAWQYFDNEEDAVLCILDDIIESDTVGNLYYCADAERIADDDDVYAEFMESGCDSFEDWLKDATSESGHLRAI